MRNFINLIQSVKGCQFANITFLSDGGIPNKVIKGNVTKIIRTDCQINYNYANAVNNRLCKVGADNNFEALSLPWGEWVEGFENRLIAHKNNLYLRYYKVSNGDEDVVWLVDGRMASEAEKEAIMAYLEGKKKPSSKRQASAGLTENQVQPRLAKVANILRLAVNGQEWLPQTEVAVATASR